MQSFTTNSLEKCKLRDGQTQFYAGKAHFLLNDGCKSDFPEEELLKRIYFVGCPYGSPISPLLFFLYKLDLMRSGDADHKFSHADDVKILGFVRISTESTATQDEVNNLFARAGVNALAFDTEKSGVIQFPGRYYDAVLGIKINDTHIESTPYTRWLRVHLIHWFNF